MILVNQTKQAIWNFDDVSRLHVNGQRNGIQVVARNGSGGELGRYRGQEQCTYVMELFAAAIAADDKVFVFPTEVELEHARQHGTSGGGRRHGGS